MIPERSPIPIARGGGKLESTRALADLGFPVPKSQYLYSPDLDNTGLLRASLRDLKPPYYVRGSHENDWQGYIDVLPTFGNLTSEEEVVQAIQAIRSRATSRALKIHSQDWDQPYSPEVHVLLQEQSSAVYAGSVLRHPHILGQIDINYAHAARRKGYVDVWGNHTRDNLDLIRRFSDGRIHHPHNGVLPLADVQEAFKYYEEVESSGLLDPKYVYQMEIGMQPLVIYQLRPFRLKEPVVDFEIPRTYDEDFPHISPHLVFGITPPEGIEMPFVITSPMQIERGALHRYAEDGSPYGLILVSPSYDALPPQIRLGKLTMAAVASKEHNYQGHGEYRFLKRAPYASVANYPRQIETSGIYYQPDELKVFEHSRYWSNGEKGLLVPSHYAHRVDELRE